MRLFMLEMKRLVKTRRTLILVFIALVFSVIMAYLPVSFESINRPGEDGSIVELDGLEALQFKKNYYRKTNGEVTPEKVADNIENEKVLKECKKQARNLISKFPLYPEGYFED